MLATIKRKASCTLRSVDRPDEDAIRISDILADDNTTLKPTALQAGAELFARACKSLQDSKVVRHGSIASITVLILSSMVLNSASMEMEDCLVDMEDYPFSHARMNPTGDCTGYVRQLHNRCQQAGRASLPWHGFIGYSSRASGRDRHCKRYQQAPCRQWCAPM